MSDATDDLRVISMSLTATTASALNARWHDQPLDLESLRFDKAKAECVFLVLERRGSGSMKAGGFVRENLLRSCRVTTTNVTDVHVSGAKGEVELYIVEVKTAPSRLSIKCVNGVLEVSGQDLAVTIEEEPPHNSKEIEVRLAAPIGQISWRKKPKSPES